MSGRHVTCVWKVDSASVKDISQQWPLWEDPSQGSHKGRIGSSPLHILHTHLQKLQYQILSILFVCWSPF